MTNLLRTPLYNNCLGQKARMTPFSGWEMPVQFEGIRQEHEAVRTAAGAFDISHMGKFVISGPDVIAQLQRLVPSDLSRLVAGKAQYTVLLNEQGGIIDDLIVYHQGADAAGIETIALIVNAGTTQKDMDWLRSHLTDSIEFQDLSREQALIAVQGPSAVDQLQKLCPNEDLKAIPRYNHCTGEVLGHKAFLARTGYTGEDGFEVMVAAEAASEVWQALMDLGVAPCGLGARDTLRLEAAMALYGQDINDSITPIEAGLSWLVHLDKSEDFVGRQVLETQKAEGAARRLVGLTLEGRNIARHDYLILEGGESVGVVTSGTLSPTLGYPVALGYVPPALAKVGQVVEVAIRNKVFPATVVKRPFYKAEKGTK
ncbi:MAG: glycine cleavage system aminomethyltransferase GcvT [Cyanobacteria bacterium P01_C01_bin.121]